MPELSFLESLSAVEALRHSRWSYALVNAAHIFGIALLIGGTAPLSLRLLGLWPDVAHTALARVLTATMAGGLAIAITTGAFLFATRASEYAQNPALQLKLLLVLAGLTSALHAHWRHGRRLETAPPSALIRIAIVSLACWTGALIAGRMIAFVEV